MGYLEDAATGATIYEKEYSEVFDANGGVIMSGLNPGDKVKFPWRPKYTNSAGQVITRAWEETLVLTAISATEFELFAHSEDYPDDIIIYTPRPTLYRYNSEDLDPAPDRGWIMVREHPSSKRRAEQDWRWKRFWETIESSGIYDSPTDTGFAYQDKHSIYERRWETAVGSGVYALATDPAGGEGYQDFPFIGATDSSAEFDVSHHYGDSFQSDGKGTPYPVTTIFQGKAYKVLIPWGSEYITFVGNATNVTLGCCSAGYFTGTTNRLAGENQTSYAMVGDMMNVHCTKTDTISVTGNLNKCEILAGHIGAIVGDYTGVTFGANKPILTITESAAVSIIPALVLASGLGTVITSTAQTAGLMTVKNTDAVNNVTVSVNADGAGDITLTPLQIARIEFDGTNYWVV